MEEAKQREEGGVWPKPFSPPATQPSLLPEPALALGRRKALPRPITPSPPSAPFHRYLLSMDILQKLQLPAAERGLDMADPLVRVVQESIAPSAKDELKLLSAQTTPLPLQPLKLLPTRNSYPSTL